MTRHASGKTPSYNPSELSKLLSEMTISWDGDESEDDTGDASGGTDDTGDEGGDGGASGASGSDAIKDPEKKRLSDEAAAQRVKARDEKTRADTAEAKLREIEDKNKTALEVAERDRDEARSRAEKAEGQVAEMSLRLSFYESGAAGLFQNPNHVRKLLDLSSLKANEDGEYDSKEVKALADAFLKENPYLGRREDDEGGSKSSGGQPSNGRKKTKDDTSQARLMKKFPALAERA